MSWHLPGTPADEQMSCNVHGGINKVVMFVIREVNANVCLKTSPRHLLSTPKVLTIWLASIITISTWNVGNYPPTAHKNRFPTYLQKVIYSFPGTQKNVTQAFFWNTICNRSMWLNWMFLMGPVRTQNNGIVNGWNSRLTPRALMLYLLHPLREN